ncbi:hypothetical protein DVH24_031289 [Malus domestica]|uniref:Uncharacterized protein n=1 Tax=Malus domestica TaxID=3750 RepID=A0A498HBW9_MALDO|nr:hypothetical protein DVH24_031289 [Malus domestica]
MLPHRRASPFLFNRGLYFWIFLLLSPILSRISPFALFLAVLFSPLSLLFSSSCYFIVQNAGHFA